MFTFYERLSGSKVRELCIRHNWCTLMTNEEYARMLDWYWFKRDMTSVGDVKRNYSEYDIRTLTLTIYRKSVTDYGLEDIAGEIFRNAVERWCE